MKPEVEHLSAILRDAAPPDLELASRQMFGGMMFYAASHPFALIWRGGVALKLVGADHDAFAEIPGVARWRYAADKPASRSYLMVPDSMLSDRAILRGWIERAAATAKPAAQQRRTRTSRR